MGSFKNDISFFILRKLVTFLNPCISQPKVGVHFRLHDFGMLFLAGFIFYTRLRKCLYISLFNNLLKLCQYNHDIKLFHNCHTLVEHNMMIKQECQKTKF